MARKKKSGIGGAVATGLGVGLLANDALKKSLKKDKRFKPGGWARKSKKKGLF